MRIKTKKAKRSQTPQEKRIATGLMAAMAKHGGGVVLELLMHLNDETLREFIHETGVVSLREAVVPIARNELHKYGLGEESNVDDAVQRVMDKLREGRCFKNYRAGETLPRTYLLTGCAPMIAKTVARSMWREVRRFRTNHDWSEG